MAGEIQFSQMGILDCLLTIEHYPASEWESTSTVEARIFSGRRMMIRVLRWITVGLGLIISLLLGGCGKSAEETAAENTARRARAESIAAAAELAAEQAKLRAVTEDRVPPPPATPRGDASRTTEEGTVKSPEAVVPSVPAPPGNKSAPVAQAPEKASPVPLACSGQWHSGVSNRPLIGPSDALVKIEFDEARQQIFWVGANNIPAQALERVSINAEHAVGWFGGQAKGELKLIVDRGSARIEIAWIDGTLIYRGKCEKGDRKF